MTATAPGQILELDTLSCGSDGGGDRALPVAGRDSLRFGGTVDCRVRQRRDLLYVGQRIADGGVQR